MCTDHCTRGGGKAAGSNALHLYSLVPHKMLGGPRSALVVLLCVVTFCMSVLGKKHQNSPYEKVRFSDIRTLTLYRGRMTTARRLEPIPQLTCEGSLCHKFQPAVIQCQSTGDNQWKCESQLPLWAQLGAVEVSCEGWNFSDDIFVLKGSCALRYELLPTSTCISGSWESILFSVLFWSLAVFIVLSLLHTCLGTERYNAMDDHSNGAPPPYQKHVTSTFSSPVTRAMSALGLGAIAGYFVRTRQTDPPSTHGDMYRPFPAYGTMPHHGVYYGDAAAQLHSDHIASSSSAHTSTGFGGSENR